MKSGSCNGFKWHAAHNGLTGEERRLRSPVLELTLWSANLVDLAEKKDYKN